MRQSPAPTQPDLAQPPRPPARPGIDRRVALIVALLTFAGVLAWLWRESFPPVPQGATFTITFPRGLPNVCEPIVTTGRTDDGDFLAVKYVDADTAVLLYDVWGVGGPTSRPFALKPGQTRRLTLELPTLSHVPSVRSRERRPLRVVLDDQVLFDEPVYFHRRTPSEIFFARNPIGGTLVKERFRGRLADADGRTLHGGPEQLFGGFTRTLWLLQHRALPLLGGMLLSAAAGLVFGFFTAWLKTTIQRHQSTAGSVAFPLRVAAPHRWFVGTAAICAFAFTGLLTSGTFRLIAPDTFGEFYDYQAAALLQGRLDLPEAARNSESFIFEGRIYMYFGPTPAILRLPFAFFDVAFGQLSRCFMLVYFVAALGAVYALLIHLARLGAGPAAWPSRASVVLFTATIGLGTTFFFLASRTYVYHEAILCGAVFALWGGYFTLRYLAEPQRAWWAAAILCGLASVHARPPSGLFALGLVGCAAVVVAIREFFRSPPAPRWPLFLRHGSAAVLAVVGVLSFNGLSYAKFRSFEGAPLKYHVLYQDGRLAGIDGKNFHLTNVPFNFATYAWVPDFELRDRFPFFYLQRRHAFDYPDAKHDLNEPTLALPYAMPLLVALATLGAAVALVHWPASRIPLLTVVAAASVMTAALLAAVAVSHRYTADFVPALLLLAAFGLHSFDLLAPRWRRIFLGGTSILLVLNIAITLAISVHYQGAMVWGVPEEVRARYESLRKSADRFLGFSRP